MTSSPRFDEVLAALRDSLDDLIEVTCARIYAELASYAGISREALAAAVTRNLTTSLSSLKLGRAPAPAMLDGAAMTSRERFAVGVPVEQIGQGFRISIALIHERFQDLAISHGLSNEEMLHGSRVLWAVSDVFTTRIITTYNALELDTALRNAQHRVQVIKALLAGELLDDPMLSAINPQGRYAALRCDAPRV